MEGYTKTEPKLTSRSKISGFQLSSNDPQSSNFIAFSNLLLKEITPTFIYQWEGQTSQNKISGKGAFRAKDNLTNQIIFWCQAEKWKNQIPTGQIQYGRVIRIQNDENQKFKERHIFKGNSKNFMKNGKGTYKIQQYFKNGQVKVIKIDGEWQNDVLLQGYLQDNNGNKKVLNFKRNAQWSNLKTRQNLDLEQDNPKNSSKSKRKDGSPVRVNLNFLQ